MINVKKVWKVLKMMYPRILLINYDKFRRIFWESMAKDIYVKWGKGSDDYKVLSAIIDEYKPRSILDVGCGSGEIDIIYGMKGYNVCGLDISQYAIEIAERHLTKQPQLSGKVRFINGNIEEIDLTDRFNTAIIYHTFEHVINPHRTLEQTIRFLNPGAKILVEVPYKKSYRDRTDLRHFSPRKLRKLLSAFSSKVEVIHFKKRRTIFAVADI